MIYEIGNYSILRNDENGFSMKLFRRADNVSKIYVGDLYPGFVKNNVLDAKIYKSIIISLYIYIYI